MIVAQSGEIRISNLQVEVKKTNGTDEADDGDATGYLVVCRKDTRRVDLVDSSLSNEEELSCGT